MPPKRQLKPVVSRAPEWALRLTLPITVKSVPNMREHPHVRARRVKGERDGVLTALRTLIGTGPMIPIGYRVSVTMTRLGGKKLDTDNLDGAFKAVRDGIADWFGVDDGDPVYMWTTYQLPGGDVGIEIRIWCGAND